MKNLSKTVLTVLFAAIIMFFAAVNDAFAQIDTQKYIPRRAQAVDRLSGSIYAYRVGSKWGIFDQYMERIIVYPRYEAIKKLSNNVFAVKLNSVWGAVNEIGETVIPIEWDSISSFEFGNNYKIEKDGLYGWYTGDFYLIEPVYTRVEPTLNKLVSVCAESGCGALKYNGDVYLPLTYQGYLMSFDDIYFSINDTYKQGVLDIFGNVLAENKYDKFPKTDHNVIYTQNNNLRGLISAHKNMVIVEPVYENIDSLSQKGFYKIKSNGKWGAVGIDGKIVYPCEYGTFEINRMMKKYEGKDRFKEQNDYNYYYTKYLQAYYRLEIEGENIFNRGALKKVLSSDNKFADIKAMGEELVNKYNLDPSKYY